MKWIWVIIPLVLLIPISAFSQESQISVQTDDSSYVLGDTIVVSGEVSIINEGSPIVLQISTEGNLVHISQITVAQDGSFTQTIIVNGNPWTEGDYQIKASYKEHMAETGFTVDAGPSSKFHTSEYSIDTINCGDKEILFSSNSLKNKISEVDINRFEPGLNISLLQSVDSIFQITLHRLLLDSQKNGMDDDFIILQDGKNTPYAEIIASDHTRIIEFNLSTNTNLIQIQGTSVLCQDQIDFEFDIVNVQEYDDNIRIVIEGIGAKSNESVEFSIYYLESIFDSFTVDANSSGEFSKSFEVSKKLHSSIRLVGHDALRHSNHIDFHISEFTVNEVPFDNKSLEACVGCTIQDAKSMANTYCAAGTHYDSQTNSCKLDTKHQKPKIASFVDSSKDPQYYIDRYNNKPEYRNWFDVNYSDYDSIEQAVGLELTEKIPDWVKNVFLWYGQDQISEEELLNAIKYLIDEGILIVI